MGEKLKPAGKEAPLSLVSIKLSWMCKRKGGRESVLETDGGWGCMSESERLRERGKDARLYRVSVVPYKDNGVCLESRLYSVFRREHRKSWTE